MDIDIYIEIDRDIDRDRGGIYVRYNNIIEGCFVFPSFYNIFSIVFLLIINFQIDRLRMHPARARP